ncbi:MAG: molybdopterin-dependent oxidoreductase [Candidatus Hydrogenedentes bacterium]|nr:molybdopterin-dependent oxidoreductase [Candidatus Hydrogenedentota bacterium]
MKKQFKPIMNRRDFLKWSGAVTAATAAFPMYPGEFASAEELLKGTGTNGVRRTLQSACPYCGVGCGTLINVEGDRIVGMIPDKLHPTNRGVQCIKGLNAHEPIYQDRIPRALVRKDMTDPITGHISSTKGRFEPEVFHEMPYDEAEEIVAEKIAATVKEFGGNSVGLSGSGQLTMETQWIENLLMKGILQSNSIEANARMCMTSAVTGYFASYGSDAPPTSYEDIDDADMITFWGHNARESHPVLFWRVADHKKEADIPTLVSDPRTTGTVHGLEAINPRNSYHFATLNGDISYLNAIAYVILAKYPEAIMPEDWLDKNTTGWRDYVEGVKARYSPQQVIERNKLLDRKRISVEQIEQVAKDWAAASIKGRKTGKGGVLTYWGIGYNQMLHGQHNTISIINLHLLTGNIGRKGCGTHSQTGQPNAMSERLMGGLTGRLPFNEPLSNVEWRDWISDSWRIDRDRLKQTSLLKNPMAIGMMERACNDDLKAMFWMYTTHIHLPDVHTLIRPALTKMFCVVQEIYRHAPNVLYGDVIFPAITWGEWTGGTYIQSERRVYICDGVSVGRNDKGEVLTEALPDMDLAIDKCKSIGRLLGLDVDTILPYKKTIKNEYGQEFYDPEDVFEDIIKASKGSDSDLTGMLEVKERDGTGLYDQLRQLRGIQWPAPTYDIAKAGGTARRYMHQEGWGNKPYENFRHKDGKAHFKLCEQDYGKDNINLIEVANELKKYGAKVGEGPWLYENQDVLIRARDLALTPELPDLDFYEDTAKTLDNAIQEDKYPLWLGLGIVYEHFHTAKTIRGATTRKLVPEQYVEVHESDAKRFGLVDGERVRVVTRRQSYEARVSVGTNSIVRPARNQVPEGYIFSPWNLSVADSADPKKNKWMVNAVSHRAWDPVSGQCDYKKCAARIERIA